MLSSDMLSSIVRMRSVHSAHAGVDFGPYDLCADNALFEQLPTPVLCLQAA